MSIPTASGGVEEKLKLLREEWWYTAVRDHKSQGSKAHLPRQEAPLAPGLRTASGKWGHSENSGYSFLNYIV